MLRIYRELTLPDGSPIESTTPKLEEFWRKSGVDKQTDLTTLKAGHSKRIMAIAKALWPDQVQWERPQDVPSRYLSTTDSSEAQS